MQECWSQDPSKRPSFQHVIIQIRGLLEGAASKQKLQKTLTGTTPLQDYKPDSKSFHWLCSSPICSVNTQESVRGSFKLAASPTLILPLYAHQ